MKAFTRVVLALLATLLCQPALGLPTSPTQKFNRDFITGNHLPTQVRTTIMVTGLEAALCHLCR